jgi:hypothetical protein
MNLINHILSFLLSADYDILQLCPSDLTKQIKRLLFSIIVTFLVYISACNFYNEYIAKWIAVVVLFIYIVFLNKTSGASFQKFVLTLIFATFVFLGLSYSFYGGINNLSSQNIEVIIIAIILAVTDLMLCFIPVNFSSNSTTYEKLVKEKNKNQEILAKLQIDEKMNSDIVIIKEREAARVKSEKEISIYTSKKILESQKATINKITEKWEKEILKEISNGYESFYSNGKVQKINMEKIHEDELNSYVSELLKEKRKDFAKIIIEKWADEKKEELKNNRSNSIS